MQVTIYKMDLGGVMVAVKGTGYGVTAEIDDATWERWDHIDALFSAVQAERRAIYEAHAEQAEDEQVSVQVELIGDEVEP